MPWARGKWSGTCPEFPFLLLLRSVCLCVRERQRQRGRKNSWWCLKVTWVVFFKIQLMFLCVRLTFRHRNTSCDTGSFRMEEHWHLETMMVMKEIYSRVQDVEMEIRGSTNFAQQETHSVSADMNLICLLFYSLVVIRNYSRSYCPSCWVPCSLWRVFVDLRLA